MEKYAIVLYQHKHGTDCWLVEAGSAVAACVGVMLESVDERTPGEQRKILDLVVAGSFTEALREWRELTDETFEVRPVHGVDSVLDVSIKSEAESRLKALPQDAEG